jgi:hypothetical protein
MRINFRIVSYISAVSRNAALSDQNSISLGDDTQISVEYTKLFLGYGSAVLIKITS